MAFVFGKAHKHPSLDNGASSPGPGEYYRSEKHEEEGFAPFNSSTFKTSSFDVAPSNTGPGCYNPKHQKQLQSDKKIRMNSTFCSKVQRFKTEQPSQPQSRQTHMRVALVDQDQPRKYRSECQQSNEQKQLYSEAVSKAKQKMSVLQSANSKRKIDSIGNNRDFVRIVLSNPKNTEIMHSVFIDRSIQKKNHGPGSYNIQSSSDLVRRRNANAVDWSRNTVQRFKQKKDKNPGPGAYQVSNGPKKSSSCYSSSFAYQGLRSHMDEVIYKTRMPFKVKVIEEKGLKDRYPGPGHYNPSHSKSKSFHHGEEYFGSTQFQKDPIHHSSIPGPGYYSFHEKGQDMKQELKKNRQKIFRKTAMKGEKTPNLCDQNREEVINQCLIEIQRTANKFYSLKERCSSKAGNFSHAQRWNGKEKSNIPGPGQYRFTQQNTDNSSSAIHYPFNSTSYDRCSFVREAENGSFYDISRNDIGKAAMRMKKNIDNLRQIDIQKAPFNTKQHRFKEAKQNKSTSPQPRNSNMVDWNTHNDEERDARFKALKESMGRQVQPSAAFKSTTKRSWAIPNHLVGPGNYYNPSSFQKKSFNLDYNYRAPIKIRPTYRTRSSLS